MIRPDPAALLADLRKESDLLEELLRSLSTEHWDLPTPAEEWTIRHQVAHEDEIWTWGPIEASQRVHGPALDFTLLATRRRHRQDGSLIAEGPDADAWLDIIQAFAGRPGPGRAPLL